MAGQHESLPDRIAGCVLTRFNALPKKRKPQVRSDGSKEWVPLAGVVLEDTEVETGQLTCAAFATGMKALPAIKVKTAKGLILHDCHAEVLAIRAFNRFLISHCRTDSPILQTPTSENQLYTVRSHLRIHFYCSSAPCGDCSMELTMSQQTDATPWTSELPTHFRGRGHFSHLGIVRTKPGRADSPETLSKSCTDKLSLHCSLSLLLTPTATLVSAEGVYISTLVVPEAEANPVGMERAFSRHGRMKELVGREWGEGYRWTEMEVGTTVRIFEFAKGAAGEDARSCNTCAIFVEGVGEETVVGGVLAGRKQAAEWRAGSMVCRAKLCAAVQEAAGTDSSFFGEKYSELKAAEMLETRRKVKEDVKAVLRGGWVVNEVDDFELA